MKLTHHNKLVRDKIPQIIAKREPGTAVSTRILQQDEYVEALDRKLAEEVREWTESHDPSELADIYEVLLAIVKAHGLNPDKIRILQDDKRWSNGGFDNKIFLEFTGRPE